MAIFKKKKKNTPMIATCLGWFSSCEATTGVLPGKAKAHKADVNLIVSRVD
jgi:hypothetical protein